MIQPNWEVFSAKFSNNQQMTFEWFAYLLFCREFDLPKGWFGFKNQSGIEKNPIERSDEVIGFQAKFYFTKLSSHKDDFLEMLEKAKRDHPSLTKILVYTNQFWGEAYNRAEQKMMSPQALLDINAKAKELMIELEWREASFFESEFVCLEHSDLAKYFFTQQKLEGWQRYDDWSNTKDNVEAEYLVDEDIKVVLPKDINKNEMSVIDGINAIREKLLVGGTSIRLVGLSGVGKTRLAQALFDDRVGVNSLDIKNVWYCDFGDSPNPQPQHFVEELIQKQKPYILIIDNCGQDTHGSLTKKIKDTQIALLTIEYDVQDDLPESTEVYKLKPNSPEIIKKVIEHHYPHINDLNARKIADFSGGNYRLALAIASNIERTDNLALLTSSELFERLFWQRGQRDDELYKVAQNFALVYSFNLEDVGEENSELDCVSKFARVDSYDVIERIEELKTKDIVQQRGIWRAILPHVLANHLAKECISRRLPKHLDEFIQNMPARLQMSCIKRLSYLHDVPKVQELVKLWFSSTEWLGGKLLNDEYDAQDLVKIRLLTHISVDQILQLLEQKHNTDPSFLTRENTHFVEISRLVRSLTYQPHNFKKASELLIYFAKDEKEGERNNSILDLVTSLFRLYTSETMADLEQKKEVLTQLQRKPEYESILLDCLSKALNFDDYGFFIRESFESSQLSEYGYQPKNHDEILDWVEFLLSLLDELDSQNVSKAREVFTNNLKHVIWKCGKVDIAKKYLERFNQRLYFPEAHSQLLNIIQWNRDELKAKAPKLLSDLEVLEQSLRPQKNNISELIKSYVLVDDHYLYRLTKDSNEDYAIPIPEFDNYDELISYISDELQNIEIVKANFEILLNAKNGWQGDQYLQRLGEGCVFAFELANDLLQILKTISVDENLHSSEFIVGILNGFRIKNIDQYRVLVKGLVNDDRFNKIIGISLFDSCKTDQDFEIFIEFLVTGKFSLDRALSLAWLKKHEKISSKQFELVVDALISIDAHKLVQYELMTECHLQNKLSVKYQPILLNYVSEFISSQDAFNYFEDTLLVLLDCGEFYQAKIFNDVKEFFSVESYISFRREDKKFKLLKMLIENNTGKFITDFVEDQNFMSKFYQNDVDKVLAYADEKEVLDWIGTDQEKINFWVENAMLYVDSRRELVSEGNGDNIVWKNLLIILINMSNHKSKLINILFENHILRMRGVFSGSWSQAMQTRLLYISSLKDKIIPFFPELESLIVSKEKEWLVAIDKQAKQDIAREKQRSEKFEW
ncbi:hypothetical protein M5F66_00920 [Acinetobacter sp. ANC 5033]|uniref:hypothetical protein n=1 Tax=Acinetobacter amyesii TaxID=2942470 RepID=UPI00201B910C|nr:hypothetical protein [Acinetobacter amyesii]MCL6236916.1 hypothetical protein [Acinetobacter amyesii]